MALRFSPARGAASFVLNSLLRGPTGAAATITAGTATALAAGSTPTAVNSGSTAAAQFDFGIPRGADAGIKWLYDSSTSMADPGSGDIRFNNATLASVTAIALSATGSGSDVSDYVATWDDSTNTTKGFIIIREEAGAVAAVFSIASVTDNTTWLQLSVTYVAGSLALTVGDPLYIVPSRTGDAGAVTSVGITQPAAGITVSGSPITSSGNMTLALANDLAALEALSTTGLVARTASETYVPRTLTGPAAGITVSNGDGVSGNPTLALANDLAALEALSATGLVARTASETYSPRTITGTSNVITVTNGDGVSGNPTLTTGSLVIRNDTSSNLTVGYTATSFSAGTKSSGTFTPDPASGNFQHYTNGGAHTLAPPSSVCAMIIECTNASAGAITTSGFTIVDGDTYSSTGTKKHIFTITKTNSYSRLTVTYVTGT
jgi:hypothetical protein